MSTREACIRVLFDVPDFELNNILAYLQEIVQRETPNAETRLAIENARKGIGLSRAFTSVAELMEDLNADD